MAEDARRRTYDDAACTAAILWNRVARGDQADAGMAIGIVEQLASHLDDDPGLVAISPSAASDGAPVVPHLIRVAMLTLALSTTVGIRGPLRLAFGAAGLLHDIGKARLPTDLLAPTGTLSADQWLLLERHVWEGERILREARGLSPLAAVTALEHHVREDGSGYPARTPRRPLNVCTSMVAIADVFDTLRTGRPDRAPLPAAAAIALMQGERRAHFHQPLVARLADVVNAHDEPTGGRLLAEVEDS